MLAEGTQAPDFTLPDQNGDPVALSDFRGRWLVLWWFPKAFTSG
jgi:peroxiredoxin Q/BCP